MPAALRWMSDLLPTNPIVLRLVAGAGRRKRDLLLRGATLGLLMLLVVFALLGQGGTLKDMAQRGASAFTLISYGQVAAICLLTPLFMAGAIAQESNPRTWEVLLTTPLSSAQIVLGNLMGRLFFAIALLVATLPLCLVTRIFGGVRGSGIFASFTVSLCTAVFLGSVAVMLSVMRSAGKRGVFAFYAATVLTLFATWGADVAMRVPVSVGSDAVHTTWITPLNPFLALRSELDSNAYQPWELAAGEAGWLQREWLGRPLGVMSLGSLVASAVLLGLATLRVRLVGSRAEASTGLMSRLLRRVNRVGERVPRRVWQNPVAWREASLRLSTRPARAARWGLFIVGVLAAALVLVAHRAGSMGTVSARLVLVALVSSEAVLALLVAISASATSVSREREDGSLDILLTTPIQPGPYLAGKLRGLIVVLWPAIATPSITLMLAAMYVLAGGFGAASVVLSRPIGTTMIDVPMVLPVAAFAFLPCFAGFMAFTVMVGLQWSVGSRGVIGSTVGALGVVVGVIAVLGLCGAPSMPEVPILGPIVACLSPLNLTRAAVSPETSLSASLTDPAGMRVGFIAGCLLATAGYAVLTWAMLAAIRRSFMMTVRRLSGLK